MRAPSPHPQACVSVAPAWHPCQHFEVDTSLPDAAMETKGWGNRRGPEEVWGRGRPSRAHPLAHLGCLVTAVMAQRNRVRTGIEAVMETEAAGLPWRLGSCRECGIQGPSCRATCGHLPGP